MQEMPAVAFVEGEGGEVRGVAVGPVAEVGGAVGAWVVLAIDLRLIRHALVEKVVARPDAGGEILIEGVGVGRPFQEGHCLAAAGNVTFKPLRRLDVTNANRVDEGDLVDAHPAFVKVRYAVLDLVPARVRN